MRKNLFVLLLCSLLTLLAQAQPLAVEASVDTTSVREGESIILTINVDASAGQINPELPDMPEFDVYETGSNFQQTIINGQVSSQIGLTYMLRAKKAGIYVIGPIKVEAGGQVAESKEITIEVQPAAQAQATPTPAPTQSANNPFRLPDYEPPPPGLDNTRSAFITAEVDRSQPFLNQQITYIVRIYIAARADLHGFEPPETTGFLVEELLPPARHYTTEIDGRPYGVTEVRTALFATSSGEHELNPARVRLTIQQQLSSIFANSPFDLPSMGMEDVNLETEKVRVDVRPLPTQGRPAEFSGAVGQYTMNAQLDKATVPAGQPVTLSVTVSGQGNVNLITPPALPALKKFRVYETNSKSQVEKKDFEVTGTRTFTTVLVPLEEGQQTLSGVKFSYFDPESEKYVTLEAPSMSLKVTPGKVSRKDAPAQVVDKLAGPKSRLGSKAWGIKAPAWVGALQAIPLLAVALALGIGSFRRWREASSGARRQSMALRRANRALKRLRSVSAVEGGKVVLSAVHGFFADRLGLTTSGLSLEELDRLLADHGLSPELRARLRTELEAAEEARYAPAGQTLAPRQKPLSRLLFEIEEAL